MSLTPFGSNSFEEALLLLLLKDEDDDIETSLVNQAEEVTFPQSNGEFVVRVDVQHFRPEELKVKLTEDYLVIEGRHEERLDEHGLISRHFVRKYRLPDNVDMSSLHSTVSSDGVLTVLTKRKPIQEQELANKSSSEIIHSLQFEESSHIIIE